MSTTALDARDLRTGGRWTAGQRAKNACIRGLVRVALALVDRLPARMLVVLGRLLGGLAHALALGARRRARATAARALPDRDPEQLVRASFVNAGESLALCLLLRRPGVRALDLVELAPDARAELEVALAPGRGAIVVSAHVGPFELIPAAVAELGLAPSVVVRESYDPGLDPLVDFHRVLRGVEVIHRGRAGAPRRIVRALGRGCPVGILPDLGGRLPTSPLAFLGAERPFPTGPARLAVGAGVPVLSATLERQSGNGPRYRVAVRPVPTRSDAAELSQCIAFALEKAILTSPEAWLWMAAAPESQKRWLEKNPSFC